LKLVPSELDQWGGGKGPTAERRKPKLPSVAPDFHNTSEGKPNNKGRGENRGSTTIMQTEKPKPK